MQRAWAHFRRVACLGLPPQAVVVAMVDALHHVVPSIFYRLCFCDTDQQITNAYSDNAECFGLFHPFLAEFDGKVDYWPSLKSCLQRGPGVGYYVLYPTSSTVPPCTTMSSASSVPTINLMPRSVMVPASSAISCYLAPGEHRSLATTRNGWRRPSPSSPTPWLVKRRITRDPQRFPGTTACWCLTVTRFRLKQCLMFRRKL